MTQAVEDFWFCAGFSDMPGQADECLLLRVKRTCRASPDTSVFDPGADFAYPFPCWVLRTAMLRELIGIRFP